MAHMIGKEDMSRDFTLLIDGENAFPEILRCIAAAQKSIYVNMFIWRDDNIGNTVARALLAAAERGVQVEISVDRYGVVWKNRRSAKNPSSTSGRAQRKRSRRRRWNCYTPWRVRRGGGRTRNRNCTAR